MQDLLREGKLGEIARNATAAYVSTCKRTEKDKIYTTLEDFTRADSKRRLVVIGCTGSGKSTLLNAMAGWRYVQSAETDYEFRWKQKTKQAGDASVEVAPIFETRAATDSVTKKTSYANIEYRGDPERELIVVDTPGHDDPAGNDIDSKAARDALGEIAADLHNKLKALGHVHAILVLHNDVVSNRLNPATYQILKVAATRARPPPPPTGSCVCVCLHLRGATAHACAHPPDWLTGSPAHTLGPSAPRRCARCRWWTRSSPRPVAPFGTTSSSVTPR